jgi:hypothetical protein
MGTPSRDRKRYTFTIDPKVMDAVYETSEEMGLSASRFIELCMKANTQMSGPVQDVLKGLFTDLVEGDRDLTPEQKKEALVVGDDLFSPVKKKGPGRPRKI